MELWSTAPPRTGGRRSARLACVRSHACVQVGLSLRTRSRRMPSRHARRATAHQPTHVSSNTLSLYLSYSPPCACSPFFFYGHPHRCTRGLCGCRCCTGTSPATHRPTRTPCVCMPSFCHMVSISAAFRRPRYLHPLSFGLVYHFVAVSVCRRCRGGGLQLRAISVAALAPPLCRHPSPGSLTESSSPTATRFSASRVLVVS